MGVTPLYSNPRESPLIIMARLTFTLLLAALIAGCFAQENNDEVKLEGRGYYGGYGGYRGYGGYGGYGGFYRRPYASVQVSSPFYGYGYQLGYRSGEKPNEVVETPETAPVMA